MNTKKTEQERLYDIVDGPNADRLFDACKYAYSKSAKVPVEFSVAIGYTAPKNNPACAYIPMAVTDIQIAGIEHEDGSGSSFNLHGYCKASLSPFTEDNSYSPCKFKAYYDARSRKGYITFSD